MICPLLPSWFAATSTRQPPGPRVLIVDDDAVNREFLCFLLTRHGLSVCEASDGESAWARLQDEPFDALISDVRMPGMSGVELCRKVYQEQDLQIPTILLTAGSIDLESSGLSEFPVSVIEKPCDPREISSVVLTCLSETDRSRRPEPALAR